MEKVEQEVQEAEETEKKQKAYAAFIAELDGKLKNNKITIEEWRAQRENWHFG